MEEFKLFLEIGNLIYDTYECFKRVKSINSTKDIKRRELQNTQSFEELDPLYFSCCFKGDNSQEVEVRQLQGIKQQGFEKVKQFLESQFFDKQLNFQHLIECFYKQESNTFQIDLEEITSNHKAFYIDQIKNDDHIFKLNQGIEDISQLLILYFQGLFAKKTTEIECQKHIKDIIDQVYKIVRQRAQQVNNKSFEILQKKLDNYSDSQLKNNKINLLCQKITQNKISFKDMSQLVLTHFKEVFEELRTCANQLYTFRLASLILNTHFKKIFDFHNKLIVECLNSNPLYNKSQNQWGFEKTELAFCDYLNEKKFQVGIALQEINYHLQFLICSVDWQQNEPLAESALFLLNQLAQFNYSIFQSQSSIKLKKQGNLSTGQMLSQFSSANKNKIEDSQKWWNEVINDQNNLIVIFQIYAILAKFNFLNNKLYFGVYSPVNRLTLIKIISILNDNQNLNLSILNFCEIITHKIQLQIFNYLETRNNEIPDEIDTIFVNLELQNKIISVMLYEEESNQKNLFWKKEKLFFNIIKPISNDGVINTEFARKQSEIIQQRLKLITKEIGNPSKSEEPRINIEVISRSETNSNIFTLLIPGFLSKNINKFKVWADVNEIGPGPGTVVALNWESSSLIDLGGDIVQLVHDLCQQDESIQIRQKLEQQNEFDKTEEEAQKVGLYLAHLFMKHNLFGGRQINIIVHSLGSTVLQRFIEVLDQKIDFKKQFINDVLIMGGMEDINKLARLRWNAVAGKVFNVYSQNDRILQNIFSLSQDIQPCGLNNIPFVYKQVINKDLTYMIAGHNNYSEQLKTIFKLIGFNNDYMHCEELIE